MGIALTTLTRTNVDFSRLWGGAVEVQILSPRMALLCVQWISSVVGESSRHRGRWLISGPVTRHPYPTGAPRRRRDVAFVAGTGKDRLRLE
jgi:hypothetical protein